MKNELAKMVMQYEFMKASKDIMNEHDQWWFEICVEEANFDELCKMWLSSEQLKVWNSIFFDLQRKTLGLALFTEPRLDLQINFRDDLKH